MQISTGIIKEPHFVLIYGVDKVGKTSFAAGAPKSIIVGPEAGSKRIDVARFNNIKTYSDVVSAIDWLRNEKHDYKSIGLDSLDWIEPTLWKELCLKHKVDSIEEVGGGYGKGYTLALSHWGDLIAKLKDLREHRQMNIIVIAHSQVRTVNDPMQSLPYDRHMLKLNEKASAKWREAVDCILFANFEDTVFMVNKGDRRAKASDAGGGNRKIYTIRRAAYDAGNRLGLPPELPLSWSAFQAAADLGTPDAPEIVEQELIELEKELTKTDPPAAARMKQALVGADLAKKLILRNHARTILGA